MPDVDLDFGNRNEILSLIEHTSAVLENGEKHNSGIYTTEITKNILSGMASIDYKTSENLGYFKLDILNNNLYKFVKSPQHLEELMAKPINWNKLMQPEFVKKLIHIGNYAEMILKLSDPIDSIEKLAMFISIIRPGKKHLQGLPWNVIERAVWDRDNSDGFTFKKSHAMAYSLAIILNVHILEEQ
jgi:hypothetical protein